MRQNISNLEIEIDRAYETISELSPKFSDAELHEIQCHYKELQKEYRRETGVYFRPRLTRALSHLQQF